MSRICKIKNRECPYAGIMKFKGDPIFGESPDWHEVTICYNDTIGRDITKCK
jgi:hypothetical protein